MLQEQMRISTLLAYLLDVQAREGDIPIVYEQHSDLTALNGDQPAVIEAYARKGSAGQGYGHWHKSLDYAYHTQRGHFEKVKVLCLPGN